MLELIKEPSFIKASAELHGNFTVLQSAFATLDSTFMVLPLSEQLRRMQQLTVSESNESAVIAKALWTRNFLSDPGMGEFEQPYMAVKRFLIMHGIPECTLIETTPTPLDERGEGPSIQLAEEMWILNDQPWISFFEEKMPVRFSRWNSEEVLLPRRDFFVYYTSGDMGLCYGANSILANSELIGFVPNLRTCFPGITAKVNLFGSFRTLDDDPFEHIAATIESEDALISFTLQVPTEQLILSA